MRIRLARAKSNDTAEPVVLFRGLPPPRPIWASFSGSAVVQALIVYLGASYLHYLAFLPSQPPVPALTERVLEISSDLNDELRAPVPKIRQQGEQSEKGAGSQAAPGPGSPHAPAREGAAPALEASRGLPAAPARAPLREFRMPAVPEKQSTPQTLVQLDLPPTLDMHPQLHVPALIMLSSEPARKLAPLPFLAPPERKKTAPVPNQLALELRPPVFENDPGYVKPSEILHPDPKLPAPVGAVSPVSAFHAPVPTKQAATVTTELATPPPLNVISLPDRPIPAGVSVVLPPLNQVSARDSISGDGGAERPGGANPAANPNASGSDPSANSRSGGRSDAAASAGSPGDREGRGAGAIGRGAGTEGNALARSIGPGGSGAGVAGAKAGSGGNGPRDSSGSGSGGSGGGPGAATSATGSGAGTAGNAGTGTGPGAGPGLGAGSGGAGTTMAGSTPLRIVRPINGNYDVAVVQSGASIPGTAGFLKGRPVYSVYLSLGDGKEWILQYCLPPDENHRAAQNQVVQLGTVTPLTAPFAYLILKPTIQLRNGVRYGFIHAFVNTSGRFDGMAEVGDPVIEQVQAVIEALNKWEFRPASKDGVPTAVEILLCIPSA
ncbi:MAG TPA: hypothetical protein VEV17_15845 [Bryobacteraceae bacterium]|nr:hypothetical protein [Bryobacteraceae bacterium]